MNMHFFDKKNCFTFDPSWDLLNILFSFLNLVLIEVWVVFCQKFHILRGFKVTHLVYLMPQMKWSNPKVALWTRASRARPHCLDKLYSSKAWLAWAAPNASTASPLSPYSRPKFSFDVWERERGLEHSQSGWCPLSPWPELLKRHLPAIMGGVGNGLETLQSPPSYSRGIWQLFSLMYRGRGRGDACKLTKCSLPFDLFHECTSKPRALTNVFFLFSFELFGSLWSPFISIFQPWKTCIQLKSSLLWTVAHKVGEG